MCASMPAVTSLNSLRLGAGLLGALPGYLRQPLAVEEAREIVRRRQERRVESFLEVVRRGVFGWEGSPYRRLLDGAACEFGDVEGLVAREGVEGALFRLLEAGVYLTVDEYKGRRAVRRGSQSFDLATEELRNPLARFHVFGSSSGSRGGGTPVLIDLAYIRACAASCCVSLEARGGAEWQKATWEIPGAGARFRLLKYAGFGRPPVKWFSQLDVASRDLDPMFRWSERAARWTARLAGVRLPEPVLATVEDPLPVARWMRRVLDAGQTPHSLSFVTSAVRLSRAATAAGIDLTGAQMTLGGEPITAARAEVVARCGVTALPRYGSMEIGPVGYPCLRPSGPDDVHLQHDLHALVQPGDAAAGLGLSAATMFMTTLHPAAPFVFLNVTLGDEARVEARQCGCPMEALGFGTHLSNVRSYEKLTAAGMTFFDCDVVEILDEVLPAKFGGGPASYQLVEESRGRGEPTLRLLVDPALGELDESAVAEAFLVAIGSATSVSRAMERLWRESGVVGVERRCLETTRSGKIHHLHEI